MEMKGVHNTNSQNSKITLEKDKSHFLAYSCICYYFKNVFKENSYYTESGIFLCLSLIHYPFAKHKKTLFIDFNFRIFTQIFC